MEFIRLQRGAWFYAENEPLGSPGGFGEVFRGRGIEGPVAVKRLKISAAAAAHRELTIGSALSGRSLKHVVPVLDCGQDADSDRYFIVMPICERSLQEEIVRRGIIAADESCGIALEILAGLQEVPDLVHRDLKPSNILFYDQGWCVADFGIAKFVEDSTSLETLRGILTPAYGAPEQWEGVRPSAATDIYALGCILHTMITGDPPFTGSLDDIREAHLHKVPATLTQVGNRLAAFVNQMLRKNPSSRPTIARCISVFSDRTLPTVRVARARLEAAARLVAVELAAGEAAQREEQAREREWDRIISDGISEIEGLCSRFIDAVCEISSDAHRGDHHVALGSGRIVFHASEQMERPKGNGPNLIHSLWTVAAWYTIAVETRASQYSYSATLIYARIPGETSFRWREASFYRVFGDVSLSEPFALDARDELLDFALLKSNSHTNLAFGPITIDGEDEEGFQDRWMTLLGRAAVGRLYRPTRLPLPPDFFTS